MKSYRIHRDVRFSPDKSPYKLWLGSLHTRPGGSMEYFHLDKSGLMVAAGAYMMDPAQLTRFRAALLDDAAGRKLERVAKALAASDVVLDPRWLAAVEVGAARCCRRSSPHRLVALEGLRGDGPVQRRSAGRWPAADRTDGWLVEDRPNRSTSGSTKRLAERAAPCCRLDRFPRQPDDPAVAREREAGVRPAAA